MKSAVVTGLTGQDGAILAHQLIEDGYKVYGLVRRKSMGPDLGCARGLENDPNLEVVEGDLTDLSSLVRLVTLAKPNEYYNLAAQSHVGISFKEPIHTFQTTGMGVLNSLEAIRLSGIHTRFYQASTSEMFGGMTSNIQTEESEFHPRSPYGCAKMYGYWITINYRESYNIFACNGVLFNHETLTYSNPLIFKDKDGQIDILPIGDIARFHTGIVFDMNQTDGKQGGYPISNIEVWDKDGWTKVKFVSGYPHKEDKKPLLINARNFVYSGTSSHVCIMEDGEKRTDEISAGDKVKTIDYPSLDLSKTEDVSLEEAEFLGMLVGDGSLSGKNPRLSNKDMQLKTKFVSLWKSFSGESEHTFYFSKSGFTGEEVGYVLCKNVNDINFDIYCNDLSPFGSKLKKVPKKILNSSPNTMDAFLRGYNACDGLKSSPCTYEFKNFKTNSMTLAAGLLFLINCTTNQSFNITVEKSDRYNKTQYYYSINLLSPTDNNLKADLVKEYIASGLSQREIHRRTGISRSFIRKVELGHSPQEHHLRKTFNEVKKIIDLNPYSGWFFDLETESGTFHAGIGSGVVHNSELRGPNFVTRKISIAVARIKKGLQDKLYLGNLDAKRDWGYAPDYTRGMAKMLRVAEPDDYILATGETHSVREFCEIAFKHAGLGDYREYVEIDPRFYRPAEVNVLIGDYSKAKRELGWEPTLKFDGLVKRMVDHDLGEILG